MDVEDDDAFLYGDQSPPPTSAKDVNPAVAGPASGAVGGGAQGSKEALGLSASMAASLAAYGIDPTEARAAPENTEDGGVEEDDLEDGEDSEDDEEDVKLVFGNQGTHLDLRRPQAQASNVIGIGKWAHGSTGTAPIALSMPPPRAQPAASGPTANQTTEYTPAPRPGAPTPTTHNIQPPLSQLPLPSGTTPDSSVVQTSAPSLPLSDLPPVTAPSSHPKLELDPTGIVPSTGTSVYELDLAQFEGSGQPWRKPGANLSDWFNFGFDEVSFPRYLRYRQEMEAGRIAMMNLPMGQMPPDVAQLLHLPLLNQMNGAPQMGFNPQQMQAMQQAMGMGNMDPGMMMAMQNMGNMPGMQGMQGMQGLQGMGNMGNMQGMGMGNGTMGGMQRPPQGAQRPSATPGPHAEAGDDVKQEEGSEPGQMAESTVPEPNAYRGRGVGRVMPGRGTARGRGTAPSGPRGAGLPANIPTGPKAGRFKDKDRVEASSGTLDYGDEAPGTGSRSTSLGRKSASPIKGRRRRDDEDDSRSRSRSRSPRRSGRNTRSPSPSSNQSLTPKRGSRSSRSRPSDDRETRSRRREDDEEASRKSEKRKREDGSGGAAVLGPGGWEEEEGGEKRSRRKRTESEDEGERYPAPRRSRRR